MVEGLVVMCRASHHLQGFLLCVGIHTSTVSVVKHVPHWTVHRLSGAPISFVRCEQSPPSWWRNWIICTFRRLRLLKLILIEDHLLIAQYFVRLEPWIGEVFIFAFLTQRHVAIKTFAYRALLLIRLNLCVFLGRWDAQTTRCGQERNGLIWF